MQIDKVLAVNVAEAAVFSSPAALLVSAIVWLEQNSAVYAVAAFFGFTMFVPLFGVFLELWSEAVHTFMKRWR